MGVDLRRSFSLCLESTKFNFRSSNCKPFRSVDLGLLRISNAAAKTFPCLISYGDNCSEITVVTHNDQSSVDAHQSILLTTRSFHIQVSGLEVSQQKSFQ